MNAILSDQERRFAAAYVANGGNATQAAIAAGYSQHTAKQSGSRLMQRPRVKNEIARLGGISEQANPAQPKPLKADTTGEPNANDQADGSTVRGEVIVLRAPPLTGEILPPGQVPSENDRELAAQLSRDWMVARLMRNAMMCLGETEQTLLKIVTKTDAEGRTLVTAAQIKAFVHDAAGANAAISQLAKITGLEIPLAPSADPYDVSHLPGRAEMIARHAPLAAEADKIRAKRAAAAAQKAASSVRRAGFGDDATAR